jgi:3-phenylpropionate/trans-cinnamate dioxygenase ferredoxin subunit
MSEYISAIDVEGFESGTMRKVDIEGHEFLVAKIGESFYVTDDRCPHLHGDLSKGVLEGSIVTCPRHHSQFDLTDGHVVRWTDFEGAVKSVASFARHPRPLRTYETLVEGGMLSVGPERAAAQK